MKGNFKFYIGALIVSILAGCTLDNISNSNSSIVESNSSSYTNNNSSSYNNNSSSNNDSNSSNTDYFPDNVYLENGWTYSGSYYDSLDLNSKNLAADLSDLITRTHKTETTYDQLLTIYKESDRDPNKPGNIIWFYSGTSIPYSGTTGGTISDTNREHVFPKDSGKAFNEKSKAGSDAHHLRPTNNQLNSERGSLSFGEVDQSSAKICKENGSTTYNIDKDKLCYKSGSYFYPGKGFRGQTARIIFYVVSRWGKEFNLKIVDGAGKCKTIGDLSTLLKWNLEEPVNSNEVHRNNVVYNIQGNRNPFIDNPGFACSIYGSLSKKAQEVCKKATQPTPPDDNTSTPSDIPSIDSGTSSTPSDIPSLDSGSSSIPSDDSSSNIPTTSKTYSLVTSASEITQDGKYIIACNSEKRAMGYLDGKFGKSIEVSIANNTITVTNENLAIYSIIKENDKYKFSCANGFLGVSSVKNLCYDNGVMTWDISFKNDNVVISSTDSSKGILQYNSQAPRFTTYATNQTAISLYKLVS